MNIEANDHGERPSLTTDDAFIAECLDKANDAKIVAAKATGGQWTVHPWGYWSLADVRSPAIGTVASMMPIEDARFVVHAHTSNPDLADRVTKLVDMVRQRDERIASQQQSTILVDGLRPDQVQQLQRMLGEMRGWKFMGHAISVGPDAYLWPNDTHGGEDKADLFATVELAQAEFATIRDAMGEDDLELVVVQLYKNGDMWEVVTPW